MIISFRTFLSTCVFLMFLLGLSGCNDGSNQAGVNNQPGSVAILLTDGPIAEFDEVNVTITQVKLLGDDRQIAVFQGRETVNLLELTSYANLFAFVDAVPAGIYSKIRLIVEDVSLIRYNGQGSDAIYSAENDDEVFHPKNSGNRKIDLNPRGPFVVVSGQTLYIQLDLDANKSIKIDETGNGDYVFRPVVFVDVVTAAVPGKLVRLSGTVDSIDDDDRSFSLCNTGLTYRDHDDDDDDDGYDDHDHNGDDHAYRQCVRVHVDDSTSFFTDTGMSSDFSALQQNSPATILGKILVDDDHHLSLMAAVVELAAADHYQRLKGTVDSSISGNSFTLLLDNGQVINALAPITVELIDGARIFSMTGDELTADDIVAGRIAMVEGIVVLSDTEPDVIKAAVVFLGEMTNSSIKLSGDITEIYLDQNTIDMVDAQLGDHCVRIDSDTGIYSLTITDASSISTESISLNHLLAGQHIDVNSHDWDWGSGCVLADVVLATMP